MPLLSGLETRSHDVQKAALAFEIDHVTNPDARQVGMTFARTAQEMILRLRNPLSEELLIEGLEILREARDKMIEAAVPSVRREQTLAQVAHNMPEPKPRRTRATKSTAATQG